MKSTNYYNTLIEIAEDCPTIVSEIPPRKNNKQSIANLKFEIVNKHPYKYTSDEVLFSVYIKRKEIGDELYESEKQRFFSKGQPCFRSSPLNKRYGWCIHSNKKGKIALIENNSDQHFAILKEENVSVIKAMQSKKKV